MSQDNILTITLSFSFYVYVYYTHTHTHIHTHTHTPAFLLAQSVKNLRAVQETWIRSLGWEDASEKEKEMTTHSSILAWKISWTQEPGGLRIMGLQKVGHD